MTSTLPVWLYGIHVADVTGNRTGSVSCRYTSQAMARWDLNLPLLSCSLPLRRTVHRRAAPFFRGLLPEGDALRAMASAAGVTVTDTHGMLARFGRDVAGALVIGDPWEDRAGDVEPYDDAALARDVLDLQVSPLGLHDDSELSLAGLQDKLLLVRTAWGWARPRHGFPSTHILKVEDRRFPGLVAHEAAALRLARAAGLTRITPELVVIGHVPCIVVDRFDREPAATTDGPPVPSRRIHQEDVCQALGIDAEAARGHGKYESGGGPGFRDVAALLDQHASDAPAQLERLLATVVFTVVVGNADGHGKNLALLHTSPGTVELAPLYDTVPTALFPTLRGEAAMSVGGRRRLADVSGADIVAEARTWPGAMPGARAVVERTAETLRAATETVDLTDELARLVRRRTSQLLDTL